jgi:sugar O-acyltransferase (sialic acid O-acetyltransferase NeuD family)
MNKLLIFPHNGNAIEALDAITHEYELIGFIDDDEQKQGKIDCGYRIFSREVLVRYPEAKVLAIPGGYVNFLKRKLIIDSLEITKKRYATVIHPRATITPQATIGYNVLIMAGVVVAGNAVVKNHVCILPNSVIHHGVLISSYCQIGSSVTVAGNSVIHTNCYLGAGSNVIDQVQIGANSLVGLGTNVIRSLPAHVKVVGNPARVIEKL